MDYLNYTVKRYPIYVPRKERSATALSVVSFLACASCFRCSSNYLTAVERIANVMLPSLCYMHFFPVGQTLLAARPRARTRGSRAADGAAKADRFRAAK